MDTIRSPCLKKKIQQQHNIKYLMPKYSVWQILSCMRERPCLVQIGINDYHLLYLHIISCIILNKYLAANEKNTILRTLSSLKKNTISLCTWACVYTYVMHMSVIFANFIRTTFVQWNFYWNVLLICYLNHTVIIFKISVYLAESFKQNLLKYFLILP